MKSVSPNFATVVAIGVIAAYWTIALVVDPVILRDIFNNLSLGVAIMVMLTWAPAAWKSFRRGAHEGEWQLVIGIFLAFLVVTISRLYSIVAISLDRPAWLVDGPVSGFIPYCVMMVGMLFLSAPGITQGAPRNRYWIHILVGVAGGALLAGFMLGRNL